MIKAEFLDYLNFEGRYQRNNKAKGRKNLRCYPSCRSTGHVKTGFCGRPVRIKVTYDTQAAEAIDILAFAQFRVCTSPASSDVLLGTAMPFAEIVNRSRGTSHNPGGKALNPWFPGVIVSTTSDQNSAVAAFSFNAASKGWHYAWQSHRMTRETRHCLHVFILTARREGRSTSMKFKCVVELFSPSFDMCSRQKQRSKVGDEKEEEAGALAQRMMTNTSRHWMGCKVPSPLPNNGPMSPSPSGQMTSLTDQIDTIADRSGSKCGVTTQGKYSGSRTDTCSSCC
jgi:hypothetical protein